MRKNTSSGNGYEHKDFPPLSRNVATPNSLTKADNFSNTILNKYFTIGDKINVYAGSKKLGQRGTFLTAGSDFFIWIDSDGYVRLQMLSGGISIGQTKKKN
ncbi:hypothetical protein [Halobacillus sp. K22]|uniref:hypothetical protein n=1 Tax=Halobacillus sp. K22 TaxID=3457431 RepID=UPI003FCEBAC3